MGIFRESDTDQYMCEGEDAFGAYIEEVENDAVVPMSIQTNLQPAGFGAPQERCLPPLDA